MLLVCCSLFLWFAGNCGAEIHDKCFAGKTRNSKHEWMCDVYKPDKESASVRALITSITKAFLVSNLVSFKKEVFSEIQTYNKELGEYKSTLEGFFLRNWMHLNERRDEKNKRLKQGAEAE